MITKTFNGKKYCYTFNGQVCRQSTKDYKYACIATVSEKGNQGYGKQMVISFGNDKRSTYHSMARLYAHWCELEVVDIK